MKQTPCRYFGTKTGCNRGSKCPFAHIAPPQILGLDLFQTTNPLRSPVKSRPRFQFTDTPRTDFVPKANPRLVRLLQMYFIDEDLKNDFLDQVESENMFPDLKELHDRNLPERFEDYCYPLGLDMEEKHQRIRPTLGLNTNSYKCLGTLDNVSYFVKQVEITMNLSDSELATANQWKNLSHPSIAPLKNVFTVPNVEGGNLFFVYPFYGTSHTLEEVLLDLRFESEPILPESTVWSFCCQLLGALRTAHLKQLYIRTLLPSSVLCTQGGRRVLIGNCGIADVITNSKHSFVPIKKKQNCDILLFGCLLLSLLTSSSILEAIEMSSSEKINLTTPTQGDLFSLPILTLQQALAVLEHEERYSAEIKEFVIDLTAPVVDSTMKVFTIDAITQRLAPHLLNEIEQNNLRIDTLDNNLYREFNNGRLLRTLIKTNYVLAHSQSMIDENTAVFKAFFEHLFYRFDEQGVPQLDWGHIFDNLNKIDTGLSERFNLCSYGNDAHYVTSYSHLKRLYIQVLSQLPHRRMMPKPKQ